MCTGKLLDIGSPAGDRWRVRYPTAPKSKAAPTPLAQRGPRWFAIQPAIGDQIRDEGLSHRRVECRRALAAALRSIYAAASEEAARQALQDFADGPWGAKYPTIVQPWQRAWEHAVPFYMFPPEILRVAYTTNAIESLNMPLRKFIKTRGHCPNDEAAITLLWLALRNVLAKTVRAAFDWKSAMNQFAILFGKRFMQARGSSVVQPSRP
ncbi:ISRSO7-transposase protein [Burkholderia pseudomallei]|nr:ISRSO7-transposase protein [Burkholderia pseudomallei]